MKKLLLLGIMLVMNSCGIVKIIDNYEMNDFPGAAGCQLRVFNTHMSVYEVYQHTNVEEFLFEHPDDSRHYIIISEKCRR